MYDFSKLIETKCRIFVEGNTLIIKSELFGDILFRATPDNYLFTYNTDWLGGDYEISEEGISIINQNPCDFQSGGLYTIKFITFYDDLLGETTVKFTDVFCELFIELESENSQFCDITFESDIISITPDWNA